MLRRLLPAILLALATLAGPAFGPASALPDSQLPASTLTDPVAEEPPAPAGEPYPSAGDITRAKAEADRRAAAATAVEAQLAGARSELAQADRSAEQSVEAFNGAQVKLAKAQAEATAATARSAQAQAARAAAAEDAAGLAAAIYRQGSSLELSTIDALFGPRGSRAAGEQAVAMDAAGSTTRRILDTATATAAAATDAERAARSATDQAQRAAEAVEQAKARAQSRLTAQQVTVDGLGKRREHLLGELAAARNTTVELERERQSALEAIAARQAEEAAKAAAAAAAAAHPQAQAQAQVDAEAQAARPPAPGAEAGTPDDAAAAAVAFARSKLGLPYIWGGEGPAGYDCSGLTMLAWQQGGKHLTHFAADQYAESTPVDYARLRPGDLVFWTHTGRAADIYHVAIYLGDDQMIEAPRPGAAIKQASLWIMGVPDFYARP